MIRSLHLQLLIVLLAMGMPALAQICDAAAGTAMQMQVQLSIDTRASGASGADSAQNDSMHREQAAGGERVHDLDPSLQIRVQLQDPTGGTLQDVTPTREGQVSFAVCSKITYRLRVTGSTLEETTLDVDPGRGDRLVNIALHRKLTKEERKAQKATISAEGLQVPKKAEKQLERGDAALKRGKLADSERYYRKALEIYPKFEEAADDLGVVLMREGKRAEGKIAFERAVAINGKYSPAQINLAKIAFDEKRFKDASVLAKQALGTEPLNTIALCVAAESAFFEGDYAETINFARSVHTLPHKACSLAHFLAGKALEIEHQPEAAIVEYQFFLDEDPGDPNAPRARELLTLLQASNGKEITPLPQ